MSTMMNSFCKDEVSAPLARCGLFKSDEERLVNDGFKALENPRYTSSSFSNRPYLLYFWPLSSFEIMGIIWTEFKMVLSLLFVLNQTSNVALGRAMSVFSWLVLQLWLILKYLNNYWIDCHEISQHL